MPGTTASPVAPVQPVRSTVWAPVAAGHLPEAVEEYRRLAGELIRAQERHGIKVVMTASAVAGEGKSVTAANLALTLSKSYRRNVLLVDADLRLPSLHEIFRVSNSPGLSDLLAGTESGRVAPVEVFSSLAILPAGRAAGDQVGLLTSPQMSQLIDEVSTRFDWVILDTPPVATLPDASLLTAMVDGILLVVAAGSTQHALLTRAIDALGRDRILGVVLNRATEGLTRKAYDHYYRSQPRGGAI
jgi:protein-tyrosine kinase